MSSKSKARLPRLPLISIRIAFLRPVANRVASKTPSAPEPNRARKIAASSTVTGPRSVPASPRQTAVLGRDRTLLDERLQLAAHLGDPVAGDELGQVDDVRADVAERAGAGLLLVQPPRQRRLRVRDPVLQVLRPHVPDGADLALGNQLPGQRDRRHPAVGEPDHRPDPLGRGLRRPPRPSPRPRRPCWPAASRRARACPPASAAIAISAWLSPGVQTSINCTSSRVSSLRQSVSVSLQPSLLAAASTASAFRPHSTVIAGCSGRSKNRGALRQACEWAAPMKAYPIRPMPRFVIRSYLAFVSSRRACQDSKAVGRYWSTLSLVTTGA